MGWILPHGPQKEPTLLTPGSWTSELYTSKFLLFHPQFVAVYDSAPSTLMHRCPDYRAGWTHQATPFSPGKRCVLLRREEEKPRVSEQRLSSGFSIQPSRYSSFTTTHPSSHPMACSRLCIGFFTSSFVCPLSVCLFIRLTFVAHILCARGCSRCWADSGG